MQYAVKAIHRTYSCVKVVSKQSAPDLLNLESIGAGQKARIESACALHEAAAEQRMRRLMCGGISLRPSTAFLEVGHFTPFTAGGCHVPLSASSFGQYSRIAM